MDEFIAVRAGQILQVVQIARVGQRIQVDNSRILLRIQQIMDKVRADKPGSSGD
jgi:hypothetical protein